MTLTPKFSLFSAVLYRQTLRSTSTFLGYFCLLLSQLFATQESIIMIPQPLDMNGEVIIVERPILIGQASPETDFIAISQPYLIPALSYREVPPHDINRASLAKVQIIGSALSADHYLISFDLAEADSQRIQRSLFLQLIECCTKIGKSYGIEILSYEVKNAQNHPYAATLLNKANIFYHRFHNDAQSWQTPRGFTQKENENE